MLANLARTEHCTVVWVGSGPLPVVDVVLQDNIDLPSLIESPFTCKKNAAVLIYSTIGKHAAS